MVYYMELLAAGRNSDVGDDDGPGDDGPAGTVFDDLPHAIWFIIVTMTTVGYGEWPLKPNSQLCGLDSQGVTYHSIPI